METLPQSPEGLPQPPQRHYGRDYLVLLSRTDFLDTNDLFFVHTFRNKYEYQELLLYEHSINKSKQQDVTHRYLVVMDPAAKNHLGSSYRPSDHPESNVDIELDQPKQLFESMVMALEATPSKPAAPSRSTRRSADQVPATKIPRFVVEIGEIKVEIYRNDGIDDIRYIGCHMVMDIESPFDERALWLVYRYRGVEEAIHLKRDRKFDRDWDLFPFLGLDDWENTRRRIPPDFDMAQLAVRAEDWYETSEGECAPIQNLPDLMQNTAFRGDCRLLTPVDLFEEFKAKMGKSENKDSGDKDP